MSVNLISKSKIPSAFVMSNTPQDIKGKPSKHREKLCRFYFSPAGCVRGRYCSFLHPGKNQDEALNTSEENLACLATAQTPKPATVIRLGSEVKPVVCNQYKRSGHCRFGNHCRYYHPPAPVEGLSPSKPPVSEDDQYEERKGSRGPKICVAFTQKGQCEYGTRCRFLHNNPEGLTASSKSHNTNSKPFKNANKQRHGRPDKRRVCRYFKAGGCSLGTSCNFLHPIDSLEVGCKTEDDTVFKTQDDPSSASIQALAPDTGTKSGNPIQPVVKISQTGNYELTSLTDEAVQILHESEIRLLLKRFPNAAKGSDGTYCFLFKPSDPDWPYDVKEVTLSVYFPENYPKEMMKIKVIPVDDRIPDILRRCVTTGIDSWVEKRYHQLMEKGRVELTFRPFLRWLDRSMEELFTEGLKAFQKELMAEAAGVQFIPAQHIQERFAQLRSADEEGSGDDHIKELDEEPSVDDRVVKETHTTDAESHTTASVNLDPTKRGTEMKLHNIQLKEGAASLQATKVTLVVQCSRCKNKTELTTPPARINSIACSKCSSTQLVTFRAALVHPFSDVLGYLDLVECSAVDLVLSESNFDLGCMGCSKPMRLQGLPPGQPKDTWCHHCHEKLRVAVDTVRFLYLQPTGAIDISSAVKVDVARPFKVQKDPAIKLGEALPDRGTCRHYKKSYRWLRFPCCGKAYPCDVCHDENNMDHTMKFANRMICGFCCKEQPYASARACSGCNSFMTKKSSSHWDGGKGCRDKNVMSRGDAKKYQNMNKTISKSAQALKDAKSAKKNKTKSA